MSAQESNPLKGQRIAIVALIIFFIVGLLLLSRVNVRQAIVEAGNDPSGVVL